MPRGIAETTEAVMGAKFAEKLGLKVGDNFTIMTPALYKASLSNDLQRNRNRLCRRRD